MNNSVSDRSFYIESEEEDDEEKEFNKSIEDGGESDSSAESCTENRQPNNPSSHNNQWPQSYSFYIESEEEDDEEKEFNKSIEDGGESDSSAESCTENRQPNNPSSHNNQWPQSYRQSIDLYGSVPSPSIGFLGTPSLSRLGSSFLSSSLTRRHTPETLPFLSKPLPTVADEQQHQQQRRSSHSLLPPLPRRYSVRKDEKASRVTHDHHPMPRHSSFAQAVWAGRQATMESDNLSSLFPNAQLSLGGFVLDAHLLFAIVTTLAVLPTVWLRDLSVLSYISAGGVIASILVVLCLFWVGLVDGVGFESKGTPLNLATLPVAMGLYGYCYSGHAVFPNIYTSLENRSQYPAILLTCFCICTLMYGGVAVMGYTMFGELTQSQFTLNMPHDLVATKIALWTTNGTGCLYPGCRSLHPLLWSRDVTDWIFIYNACSVVSSAFGTFSAISKIVESLRSPT
ncbi:hypothetical protein C1H46_041648 [Malus baccata]|uniref:Amino acid transporter transmembrane domain-containing protein n=1 Tax=Malus baccata TaxID=106549 RepID=A0A540KF01_MALBA|nr:hypothetical protein C1H46_041648 [Malus baccata]